MADLSPPSSPGKQKRSFFGLGKKKKTDLPTAAIVSDAPPQLPELGLIEPMADMMPPSPKFSDTEEFFGAPLSTVATDINGTNQADSAEQQQQQQQQQRNNLNGLSTLELFGAPLTSVPTEAPGAPIPSTVFEPRAPSEALKAVEIKEAIIHPHNLPTPPANEPTRELASSQQASTPPSEPAGLVPLATSRPTSSPIRPTSAPRSPNLAPRTPGASPGLVPRAISPPRSPISLSAPRSPASLSPRLSHSSSQIFERNVQEYSHAPASPSIPAHILTDNHVPAVLSASSAAITGSLNPDEVEIVTASHGLPFSLSGPNNGSAFGGQFSLQSPPGVAVSEPSDAELKQRLSFISFADVVAAEQAMEGVGSIEECLRSPSPRLGSSCGEGEVVETLSQTLRRSASGELAQRSPMSGVFVR
ncbi:hypothetical protein BZA77DRAFT_299861 [Pyronema omphalodes]|nr:hypothetical protein BZA77DRAFT_299861 [Pyronema omphalodes]